MISNIKNKWLRRLAIIAAIMPIAIVISAAAVIDALWVSLPVIAEGIDDVLRDANEVWDRE